jgi:hypothetical protein
MNERRCQNLLNNLIFFLTSRREGFIFDSSYQQRSCQFVDKEAVIIPFYTLRERSQVMGKLMVVFLTVLLFISLYGCGPYRCPEEEAIVVEAEPTVITEYVEKEELVLSMSYILFYASGRYMPGDANPDVLAQLEDEILTWGEMMRRQGVQLKTEKILVWGNVDGQPLSPRLYNELSENYSFDFTPPAYNAQSAYQEGNQMLSEARATEMATHVKKLLTDQGIVVDGHKEIGASTVVLAERGEINPMARRVTIRVEVRGEEM